MTCVGAINIRDVNETCHVTLTCFAACRIAQDWHVRLIEMKVLIGEVGQLWVRLESGQGSLRICKSQFGHLRDKRGRSGWQTVIGRNGIGVWPAYNRSAIRLSTLRAGLKLG